jgi:hypothetical protein
VSLGIDGSPKSIDSAIRADSKTALRREVIGLRAENQHLRQQVAEMSSRIDELEAKLKQYENAHTPSSKKGGAGGGNGRNGSDDNETDDDSSPVCEEGHEATTRTPPEPEETRIVGNGFCPDCEHVLTDPDDYTSQIVIDTPLLIQTTVVEYNLGKHECSCGNEVVAEHLDCPQTERFGPNIMALATLSRSHRVSRSARSDRLCKPTEQTTG